MGSERSPNVQDVFLNSVRKQRIPLTLFLVNGVKLQGILASFDAHTLLIRRDIGTQLVFKHAVSTIVPHGRVNIFEGNQGFSSSQDFDDEEVLEF